MKYLIFLFLCVSAKAAPLVVPQDIGPGIPILASTQTFSGANTFVSSITLSAGATMQNGIYGYTANGIALTANGIITNSWQVVASTYVVGNSSVSIVVPDFSSATWRYTVDGIGTGTSATNWLIRFNNDATAGHYITSCYGIQNGGAGYACSSNGTIAGCRSQATTGNHNAGDLFSITSHAFRPPPSYPGVVMFKYAAGGTYQTQASSYEESTACFYIGTTSTKLTTISLVPPVGFTGWVKLEKLQENYAQ